MSFVISVLVAGLAIGSVYALLAYGYALVFKASHTINLALGAFMLLSSYIALELGATGLGLPFWAAFFLAAAAIGLLGWLAFRFVGLPLVGASPDALVVATIGLDLAIRSLIQANHKWVLTTHDVGAPWSAPVGIAGVSIAQADLWIIGITAAVLIVLGVLISRTSFGLHMRACAEDPEAAQAQGISSKRNLALAWIIAAVLAAIAGVLVGASPRTIDPSNFSWALRALPAVVLGGMDSLKGAVIGGLAIGLIEALAATTQVAWLGEGYQLVLPYALMLVLLLLRPAGLFGSKDLVRV
ncbi:branched-chain amino acid ABC transporter permease [Microbacterium luticocti]|uniref:branched-chain amino acid ABC transporter permease n=1 Tax=Microbacterium luticocti TaxID=451764 RepID=UPI000429E253|nr:branched-chain amino acid ABC transporter permease [Microbacterium luticocti]